jgi:hypothetical protein
VDSVRDDGTVPGAGAKMKGAAMLNSLRHRGVESIVVRPVEMGPVFAQQLVNTNTEMQRRQRGRRVVQYARLMEIGLWQQNGDTIKIGKSGKLLDGQHRLLAVIKSGCTVPMLLAENVDDAAFITMDVGANRTTEDMLYINGDKSHASKLACAVRWLYRYGVGVTSQRAAIITNADLLPLLAAHPGLRDSVTCISHYHRAPVSRGFLVFLHYVGGLSTSMVDADDFVSKVFSGANLSYGHPIMLLRNRFGVGAPGRKKMVHERIQAAITIKAWNAVITERTPGTLKWAVDEPFPEIINFPPSAVKGISRV